MHLYVVHPNRLFPVCFYVRGLTYEPRIEQELRVFHSQTQTHQWKQRRSWFSVVLLSKEDYLSFNMLNIGTKLDLLTKTCKALVTNSLEASQPDYSVQGDIFYPEV